MPNGSIFILGGDGFCGWPTALHLSKRGYDVTIIDNLSRRKIDHELSTQSLTPIATIETRLKTWKALTGKTIPFHHVNIAQEYDALLQLIKKEQPTAIVHFAEQRAAPYSMRSPKHKRYTVENNINATHNLLCAVVEAQSSAHIVHLGTMGVYGYGGGDYPITEGYIEVDIRENGVIQESKEILHPMYPGSVYHTTKCLDEMLFYFYNKNDKLKITDLHQGIVWGTNTEETSMDVNLINRFDYDGDYGTVLNRFIMQAACNHPLTLYGTGGQTRAFIHIQNSVNCIRCAIESPPNDERVRIINQVTETHQLKALADFTAKLTGATIGHYENPRNEAEQNDLLVSHRTLTGFGIEPILLQESLCNEIFDIAKKYIDRCDTAKILNSPKWSKSKQTKKSQKTPPPKNPLKGISAILLDCDGVLIDSESINFACWLSTLKKLGYDTEELTYLKENAIIGKDLSEIFCLFEKILGQKIPSEDHQKILDQKNNEYKLAAQESLELMPGVIDFLMKAEELSIPLFLVSNSVQEKVLFAIQKFQLNHFFKEIICGDSQKTKDFSALVSQLHLDPKTLLVVDDAPASIKNAKSVPIEHCIGISGTFTEKELLASGSSIVIDNLSSPTFEQYLSNNIENASPIP